MRLPWKPAAARSCKTARRVLARGEQRVERGRLANLRGGARGDPAASERRFARLLRDSLRSCAVDTRGVFGGVQDCRRGFARIRRDAQPGSVSFGALFQDFGITASWLMGRTAARG